jgi:hypothetical protein
MVTCLEGNLLNGYTSRGDHAGQFHEQRNLCWMVTLVEGTLVAGYTIGWTLTDGYTSGGKPATWLHVWSDPAA